MKKINQPKPRYVARYSGAKSEARAIHHFEKWTRTQPIENIRRWNNNPEETYESCRAKAIQRAWLWDGYYEKLGGGLTTELTEANIIGWKKVKEWEERGYDLLPIKIVIDDNHSIS